MAKKMGIPWELKYDFAIRDTHQGIEDSYMRFERNMVQLQHSKFMKKSAKWTIE